MIRKFIGSSLKLIPQSKFNWKVPLFVAVSNRYFFSTKDPKNSGARSAGMNVDESFKQQSKQFYNNQVEKIIELKSSAEFEGLVSSIAEPIVLDLYADWCGPCKILTPKLQKKVNSLQNVKMIKVNIDKCPEIAQALKVKSVPTVYLIIQGQAIDRFQGNVGQNQFNKFFETLSKVTGDTPQYKQATETLQKAKLLINQKKIQQAVPILQNFKQKKVGIDLIGIKQLLLTQCYLTLGKASKFRDSITRAQKYEDFYRQVPSLNQFYQILKEEISSFDEQSKADPEITQLKEKIEKAQGKDQKLQAKFALVNYYKSKQMAENALEIAMEIIKEDKNWGDKKTNQLVLAIFKQLGNASPVVQNYRRILQRLLS